MPYIAMNGRIFALCAALALAIFGFTIAPATAAPPNNPAIEIVNNQNPNTGTNAIGATVLAVNVSNADPLAVNAVLNATTPNANNPAKQIGYAAATNHPRTLGQQHNLALALNGTGAVQNDGSCERTTTT
jgi:hypothetical protein